jgi:hypothetical protein
MIRYLQFTAIEMLLIKKFKDRGLGANSTFFYVYFIQYLSLCVICRRYTYLSLKLLKFAYLIKHLFM